MHDVTIGSQKEMLKFCNEKHPCAALVDSGTSLLGKTTLETSEDENYTRNEWRWKLHSKRVKMEATLETSEDENYTRNEWRWKLHLKRVNMKTTLETSED